MKYIWILRLILYNVYGKNGWAGSVYEGASFSVLLGVLPFTTITVFLNVFNIKYIWIFGFIFWILDIYLSNNENNQQKQFDFYSSKRKELSKEFARVRLFILLNFILFILSFLWHAYRKGDLVW